MKYPTQMVFLRHVVLRVVADGSLSTYIRAKHMWANRENLVIDDYGRSLDSRSCKNRLRLGYRRATGIILVWYNAGSM